MTAKVFAYPNNITNNAVHAILEMRSTTEMIASWRAEMDRLSAGKQ